MLNYQRVYACIWTSPNIGFFTEALHFVSRVVAEKLKGVDARYELSKTSQGVRQAADIRSWWARWEEICTMIPSGEGFT